MKKYFSFLLPTLFIISCSDTETVSKEEIVEENQPVSNTLLTEGNWLGKLDIGNGNYIPFNFSVEGDNLTILNSSEKIICPLDSKNDSVHFKMPVFDSEFFIVESEGEISGFWHNFAREDYAIPFTAQRNEDATKRFNHIESTPTANYQGKWESTFGYSDDDLYKAIGVFEQYDDLATGTFVTETGDYRFLQGNVLNDTLFLSCFDGSHAFLFKSFQNGDSLKGEFFSGKHYRDEWVAVRNEGFELANPDSLTYIQPGQEFAFSFPGVTSEDSISFPSEEFAGKVTMVQIFGSWCPNCMDEVTYYTDLYERYHEKGLEIVGLGFEIPEELEGKKERIRDLIDHTKAPYHFAVGGRASKSEAQAALPSLNHVMSFPTTIFIDRSGNIQKIHTGFYGPGTGSYFQNYKEKIEAFIEGLLAR